MQIDAETYELAQIADLRKIALTWENFGLAMSEFQVACRYADWERAEEARLKALASIEANFDAFQAVHTRNAK